VKETKKGTREVDMREWIYDVKIHEEDASTSVYLRLCCSVGDNLKPEQLFGEMFRSYGHELPQFALQVHRLDLLTRNEAGDGYVSLGDLGRRIE
jgi:hypothetical protein